VLLKQQNTFFASTSPKFKPSLNNNNKKVNSTKVNLSFDNHKENDKPPVCKLPSQCFPVTNSLDLVTTHKEVTATIITFIGEDPFAEGLNELLRSHLVSCIGQVRSQQSDSSALASYFTASLEYLLLMEKWDSHHFCS
jgi:hypothetical protein